MYNNFGKLLVKNNKTAYRVAKDTGISPTTFADWKSGRSTPKIDKLQKIADYFNVPVSYFIEEQNSEDKKTPPAEAGSVFEDSDSGQFKRSAAILVTYYRQLDEQGRAALMSAAQGMALAQKSNTITIPVAARGGGLSTVTATGPGMTKEEIQKWLEETQAATDEKLKDI